MKKILLISIIMILFGCSSTLTTEEINKIMAENEYIIIDVRTRAEYEEEHIKEAINIPLEELDTSIFNKDKTIFVYCKTGNRSTTAYKILKNKGYIVYNLKAISSIELPKEKNVNN